MFAIFLSFAEEDSPGNIVFEDSLEVSVHMYFRWVLSSLWFSWFIFEELVKLQLSEILTLTGMSLLFFDFLFPN